MTVCSCVFTVSVGLFVAVLPQSDGVVGVSVTAEELCTCLCLFGYMIVSIRSWLPPLLLSDLSDLSVHLSPSLLDWILQSFIPSGCGCGEAWTAVGVVLIGGSRLTEVTEEFRC